MFLFWYYGQIYVYFTIVPSMVLSRGHVYFMGVGGRVVLQGGKVKGKIFLKRSG